MDSRTCSLPPMRSVRLMKNHGMQWVFFAAALFAGGVHAAEKLHPRTQCPLSGSKGQTILLIDSTDPLPLAAHENLKQLFRGFRDSSNDHYLPVGNELIVYHLAQKVSDLAKPVRVCNPGNPADRTWVDDLTSGKVGAQKKWRRFEKRVLDGLPAPSPMTRKQSPLLETIRLIAAKHASSIGVGKPRKPTNMIVFSDMLQHSAKMSHYKNLPEIEALDNPAVKSNLMGVDVWLYYVQRPDDREQRIQTTDHFHWWTRAVEFLGGKLMEQNPL